MRVLVYGLSSDKLGGIETFLLNMNKFMSDDMIFDYVVEGNSTIHQAAIQEKGGDVFFISPKRNMLKNIRDWERILKEYRKISRVVYFNMFSLAWAVPIFLAKIYGYNVIIHAHNNNLHDCGMILKYFHSINRKILKYIKVERYTNSDLSSYFFFENKKSKMIYNAIDTERFAFNAIRRKKLRNELNLDGKNVYGFSGRLAYQKNPLFLIDIFSEIKKIDPKAAFLVCGDGELMESVKQSADQHEISVRFVGNVLEIEEYYCAMDCYILPSRFEGLGIVLIEAQCSGLSCITSSNVVPSIVQVTDLLEFVELSRSADFWAKTAYDALQRNKKCLRDRYSIVLKTSGFNINTAARELEKELRTISNEYK